MKKLLTTIFVTAVCLSPALVFAQLPPAQAPAADGNLQSFIEQIADILNILLPIFVTLAVLAFFWGLIKFIFQAGDEREKGKNIMIWGIIALFVIVSIWGIVAFLSNLFGIGTGGSAPVPGVDGLGA